MQRLLVLFFLIAAIPGKAQYTGGNNDGAYLVASQNQNPLPSIYTGGNNDGYSRIALLNQNTLPDIYHGGNNDGVAYLITGNQNSLPNIYKGDANDGYYKVISTSQNLLPGIYTGGNNDGFHRVTTTGQNLLPGIYDGGNNDGIANKTVFNQNPLCDGVITVWNGSVSTAWENAANWNCGVLPGTGTTAIIPSGLSRYPIVSFSYEIKTLYLQTGATIQVLTGVNFVLNGQ